MAYTNEALGKALEDLTAAYHNFIEKAKEAAMSALSDTVIAQITQDAKEYIASELAGQKNALTQAIEHAQIALHNSAIEADTTLKQTAEAKKRELAALITAAENTLNEKSSSFEKRIQDTLNTRLKDAQNALTQQLQEAQTTISKMTTDFNQGVQTALSSLSTIGEVRFFSHAGYTPGFLYANGSSFIPELYPAYYALWQKLHNNPKSTAYCGYDRFGYPKTPDLRKNAPSPLYPFIKV